MTVHIVDYGVGNLYSILRAVEASGGTPVLATDPSVLRTADRVILPGVGAFEPCARQLRESGMWEAVVDFAGTGQPFLGICVGMQLLFDASLEFGRHAGLGLIPGQVVPIPPEDEQGVRKVPHIGWRPLDQAEGGAPWEDSLLSGLTPRQSSAYFVHSYNCAPEQPTHRLADVDYRGYAVCAAVKRDNISGFQCHPEKSGPVGLKIMQNFLTA